MVPREELGWWGKLVWNGSRLPDKKVLASGANARAVGEVCQGYLESVVAKKVK